MNSADSCNAGCASRVIQTAQESSQTARSVATSVAGVLTEMEYIQTMVDGIKDNTDDIEGQVIQLRIDILQLSKNITTLKESVDNSMVPTVDDNIIREVPIYDANKNVSISIKSTHPAPATIHNLTWEGAYNTKFYQRV